MDVIVNSKHKAFCDYIKTLLPVENGEIHLVSTADDCIEKAISPNTVIILDAHSQKPYSTCSAIGLLDKLLEKELSCPVIILGWLKEDYLKTTGISWHFNAICEDSYKYWQLPATRELLLSCIQSIKPLTDFSLQMMKIKKQYNTYVEAHDDKSFEKDVSCVINTLRTCKCRIQNDKDIIDDVESIKINWNRIYEFISLIFKFCMDYKEVSDSYLNSWLVNNEQILREIMNIGKDIRNSLSNNYQEIDKIQFLINTLIKIDREKILGKGSEPSKFIVNFDCKKNIVNNYI